jgi:hypothetical protein
MEIDFLSQGPGAAKNKFAKLCTGQKKKLKQEFTHSCLFMAGLQYNPADIEAYGCNTTEATELRLGSVSSRNKTHLSPQSLIEFYSVI